MFELSVAQAARQIAPLYDMSQLLLYNANVVSHRGIESGGVLVRDGLIVDVYTGDSKPAGLASSESVDLLGTFLAPGMIDIHIHGSRGVDVLDADRDGLNRLSEFLLTEGVTGYFATVVPADETTYRSALGEITGCIEVQDGEAARRARILGIHFEGPFVSHNRCGALQRRHFRTFDGDARSLELFIGKSETPGPRTARLMTLAPETEGGIELIRELTRNEVRAFIGHTQADLETLDLAADTGARHITHFPNALDPLHHRKPGAIGWGFVNREVTVDCIADLHHVHPLMLQMIYQAKSADRIALISDAILPTGLGDGEFTVWGDKIAVRDGLTRLVGGPAEGTIAGSVITMRQALANMTRLGVPLHEAVQMASIVPARAAGIESRVGSIEKGKRADLISFDEEFNVRLAVVGGEVSSSGR